MMICHSKLNQPAKKLAGFSGELKPIYMKIYIASSWKHKHGVEMLTTLLRDAGHEVISWIENCSHEGAEGFVFWDWFKTDEADECFMFDIQGAMTSDLVIYYGNAGKDACIEIGAAYGSGVEVIGLHSKGEDMGLMSKIISHWFSDYRLLLAYISCKHTDIDDLPF